jgi:hypothetical protein
MVFTLGIMYLRRSARIYDPLAERVREIATQTATRDDAGDYSGRFTRDAVETSTTTEEVGS